MAEVVQVRFSGFGGQGVVLMGSVLGEAAVRAGFWAAGSNSYGAQARGSACSADVVLSRAAVDFPHVLQADVLVVLSQGAYDRFRGEVRPGGWLVFDSPQVVPAEAEDRIQVPVPATRWAMDRLGSRQVANTVLLAATVALAGLVPRPVLLEAVRAAVPAGHRAVNETALGAGFRLGEEAVREAGLEAGALAQPLTFPAGPAEPRAT